MEQRVENLGFVGSLRRDSYNRALMRAAVDFVSDDATIEVFDLAGIPLLMENQPPQACPTSKPKSAVQTLF